MISCYTLFDGTAVQLADEHESTYSAIFIYSMWANLLCSFIPALIIKNADQSNTSKLYAVLNS